jgi:aspartate/methionine/tyrosine aminotransferase
LLGVGAYFAYMAHPFAESSADLAQRMVREQSILCLPGTMFCPEQDPSGARQLRIAFANLDVAGIGVLFDRLGQLRG